MAIVTLLTDFGLSDHFVAVMKGIILSSAPETRLVDITHNLRRHDIRSASFLLDSTWRDLPKGSIHLAVVDPGVGTERRGLAVASGGHYFIAPDNGLLSPVLPGAEVRMIERRIEKRGSTFDGRDLFAPAAAELAGGLPFERIGERVEDPVLLPEPRIERTASGLVGEILHIDRFGNLMTNIPPDGLPPRFAIGLRGGWHEVLLVNSYSEAEGGGLIAVVSSNGMIEIARGGGSAAELLGASPGERIAVNLAPSVRKA